MYIILKSVKKSKTSYVRLTYYPKNKNKEIEALKPGTSAYAYGFIRAKNVKDENGKFQFKHYFVAQEVNTI